MTAVDWQVVDAIAAVVSAAAIVAGTIFVVAQLRQAAKDRYVTISSHMFEIWQSRDFQEDQLFLLHKLPAASWDEFIAQGRGSHAERAFHRVGGFYDRIGHLVLGGFITQEDILPTIGGDALAVWQRIESLVREARRHENSFLFQNYEAVLPNCLECYLPVAARPEAAVAAADEPERIEPQALRSLMERDAVAVLDVSKDTPAQMIKGALRATPNELAEWVKLAPPDGPVIVYCS